MSVRELTSFIKTVTSAETRAPYPLLLTVHYVLLHGGYLVARDESPEQFTFSPEGAYGLLLDKEFCQRLLKTDDSAPSLGVLRYRASELWPLSAVHSNLTFAWSCLDENTALCHILVAESNEVTNSRLNQIGSLSFTVSDFTDTFKEDPKKAMGLVFQKLKPILWPPVPKQSEGTNSAMSSSAPSAPMSQAGIPGMPGRMPNYQGPRPDGGMFVGPQSSIYQNPLQIPNPGFRYDVIDPLGGSGSPWPDDLHGDLPRRPFGDPTRRPGHGFGGGSGPGGGPFV
eukprot:Protomagalhaensia_wolfi_Nauph_80__2401@NODE_2583_length_1047_cov_33_668651_g2022_i0_p1_GENE_NODE_2583_length_1047_cov_33_668651_g2022_i0NODE_2583_length_1047_cov_33_668651_g2022_i0_p1_ORF_typecomplete_len283_score30_55_NODE_2583_length_1047_cov_33_668651_g2022_i0123971